MAATQADQTAVSERDVTALAALVDALGGRNRKARQGAAHTLAQVARTAPEAVVPFAGELAEAVECPEAQTRWEALDALASVARVDPDAADCAFEAAQESLYDEESGMVRLAAFRYFSQLGAAGPAWSVRVWPLVNEAVQCCHGDPEFDDMLAELVSFAQADLDPSVREALVERMSFDACNGRGTVAQRARQIVEAAR